MNAEAFLTGMMLLLAFGTVVCKVAAIRRCGRSIKRLGSDAFAFGGDVFLTVFLVMQAAHFAHRNQVWWCLFMALCGVVGMIGLITTFARNVGRKNTASQTSCGNESRGQVL